jgi:hypothetical protein
MSPLNYVLLALIPIGLGFAARALGRGDVSEG